MEIEDDKKIEIPNYGEFIKQIKEVLRLNFKTLSVRVFFITWPIILLSMVLSIAKESKSFIDFLLLYKSYVFTFVMFCIVYVFVAKHLFFIEKLIWTDSYFHKLKISYEQSFKIAKKMFWKSLKIKFILFFRYYFIFVVPYLIAFYFSIKKIHLLYLKYDDFNMDIYYYSIVLFTIVIPLILVIYIVYMRIKLRYFWFLFIDNYSRSDFSYKMIIEKMNELNKAKKKETFKKALVMHLGIDFFQNFIDLSTYLFLGKAFSLFKSNNINWLESAVTTYAKEVNQEIFHLSKSVANYVLYDFSKKYLNQKDLESNNIYNLID